MVLCRGGCKNLGCNNQPDRRRDRRGDDPVPTATNPRGPEVSHLERPPVAVLLFADDAIFDIGDEDKDENAWAWPDAFGLGCCLAPEPTTPATPGVRFVGKAKRQRVPEEA